MPLRSPRKLKSELPGQSGPALPRTRGGFFVPGPDRPCFRPAMPDRSIGTAVDMAGCGGLADPLGPNARTVSFSWEEFAP